MLCVCDLHGKSRCLALVLELPPDLQMLQAHTLGEKGESVYPGKQHALCPINNDQFLKTAEGHSRYHILCLGFRDLELVRCIVEHLRQLEI